MSDYRFLVMEEATDLPPPPPPKNKNGFWSPYRNTTQKRKNPPPPPPQKKHWIISDYVQKHVQEITSLLKEIGVPE